MKRLLVLVVEDEAFLTRVLKDNLEVVGYEVDMATNGEEAMEHIQKSAPNIILLDLLMPKRDGFFVLEQVKKHTEWKTIPVIVLSNLGGDVEIQKALKMGANAFFVKSQHPIEEVVEEVRSYLAEGKSLVHK